MNIAAAQREMRAAFLGGFAGQLVASLIWALSAAVSLWLTPTAGMATLFFGSMLLFPLTQILLRAIGRSASLSAENTLAQLAQQVAFTVPFNFILVAAIIMYRPNWFYPASMVIVGTHYLPFIFLYGMWQFGLLAALLVGGGVLIGLYGPDLFSLGGWVAAIIFLAFAFAGRSVVLREEAVQT